MAVTSWGICGPGIEYAIEEELITANPAAGVLKKLGLDGRKEEGLKAGKGEPESIIFHTKGKHTSQNTIRNIWKRLLIKAGLENQRLHNTRHTYASILLSNRESPVYVKEQLGHSSIQMTVDIYGQLIPNSNRDAVNRLDNPHSNTPHPHPPKTEKPQPVKIMANS
jgi:integrase